MKVIINVSKTSAFSHFNGKTYEVSEIGVNRVTITIFDKDKQHLVDFSFREVFIVELEKEYKKSFEFNLQISNKRLSDVLEDYMKVHGFKRENFTISK